MKILSLVEAPHQKVLETTLAILRSGGLVIFPTETTYGAGVDALNPAAVQKLLEYKARREGKPLSIAVRNLEMAEKYVEVNDSAKKVYERFLPGPVTVVSKGKGKVAMGIESEFGTLGVRIPDYAFVLELLSVFEEPITATSANQSGSKSPYSIQELLLDLSEKQKSQIDLIIDAGELPHNPPSTVIDTTLSTPVVFRQGDVEVIKPQKTTSLTSHSEQETKDIAKRLLLKHWNEAKETGLVIGLNGSLGMGKTIFAKGVAEFLQIPHVVTSPTYTYLEEYAFERHNVTGKFHHVDAWKISSDAEMELLRFSELPGPNQVVIIEWVSNVASYMKKIKTQQNFSYIEVAFGGHDHGRTLEIKE